MGHQIDDSDIFMFRILELGEPAPQSVQQGDLSLIYKLHQRWRSCNYLCQGSDIEDGLLVDWWCTRAVGQPPTGGAGEDTGVVAYHNDATGNKIVGNGQIHEQVYRSDAAEIQSPLRCKQVRGLKKQAE